MTIVKLVCRMDGTQESVAVEVPDDWGKENADAQTGALSNAPSAERE